MDKLQRLVVLIEQLAEKYDEEKLLDGLFKVVERAHKSISDGRITVFEALGIGMAVLELLHAAKRS